MKQELKHALKLFLVATIAIIVVALFGVYPPLYQNEYTPASTQPFVKNVSNKINVNTAPFWELMLLPGIGEEKSQAIIDYRTENGEFETVDEMMDVHGIGPKTLQELEDMVVI